MAAGKLAASVEMVSSSGDPIGPFMARNARWIAPIMIAVESAIFGQICMNVEKYFLHFLQCQVFKTPLDLSLTNCQSLLVMKSSCFQTVAQRSIWSPNWTIHGPKCVQLMFSTIRTAFSSLKSFSNLFSTLLSEETFEFMIKWTVCPSTYYGQ